MPPELDRARYVSFTSYKKDGSPVALPVWIVNHGDGYAFTTDAHAHKVARVLRDPRATLRVCDMRGRVAAGAAEFTGTAEVLYDEDARAVAALVKKKYRIGSVLLGAMETWRKVTRRGPDDDRDCAILMALEEQSRDIARNPASDR